MGYLRRDAVVFLLGGRGIERRRADAGDDRGGEQERRRVDGQRDGNAQRADDRARAGQTDELHGARERLAQREAGGVELLAEQARHDAHARGGGERFQRGVDEHAQQDERRGQQAHCVERSLREHADAAAEVAKRHEAHRVHLLRDHARDGLEDDGGQVVDGQHERHERRAAGDFIGEQAVSDGVDGIAKAADDAGGDQLEELRLRPERRVDGFLRML